ncbi:hypothetical protein THAOC_12992 [Thalassiosira oceanica]|uniref:Uncharacterized protein n=1 Tax=Thalassiosira oceanica TaxID=159749 RepID=K0SIQ5_THAOC|nr:hypothetical protein THAOC_12992 [Thalassiosira oceanica]|eukprot:EJK66103.1 hypothetical protein THAOC_12992 [Thalassiosira oceanica]
MASRSSLDLQIRQRRCRDELVYKSTSDDANRGSMKAGGCGAIPVGGGIFHPSNNSEIIRTNGAQGGRRPPAPPLLNWGPCPPYCTSYRNKRGRGGAWPWGAQGRGMYVRAGGLPPSCPALLPSALIARSSLIPPKLNEPSAGTLRNHSKSSETSIDSHSAMAAARPRAADRRIGP